MEMIMSTASNTIQHGGSLADSFVRETGRTLRRWCTAYFKWRLQQSAISQLESMSDRELEDVGISRAQINLAVKGEAARDAMSRRFYC
jgi:uncharacterized protein YjiS (DUF1127 family)